MEATQRVVVRLADFCYEGEKIWVGDLLIMALRYQELLYHHVLRNCWCCWSENKSCDVIFVEFGRLIAFVLRWICWWWHTTLSFVDFLAFLFYFSGLLFGLSLLRQRVDDLRCDEVYSSLLILNILDSWRCNWGTVGEWQIGDYLVIYWIW